MLNKTLLIIILLILIILIGFTLWNTFSIRNLPRTNATTELLNNNDNLLEFFVGVAIIGIIALVGFTWWNGYNLSQLRQQSVPTANLNDRNYWELYYKVQFQATAFTVAVALIAFFGYTTIKDAKKDVQDEVQSGLKSQDILITKNKQEVDALVKIYGQLASDYPALQQLANNTKGSFSELQKEVNDLSAKDILKQPIFIVNNIFNTYERFDTQKHWDATYGGIKIPFSEMRTVSNEKLPIFKNPPSVLLFTTGQIQIDIRQITKDAIYVDANGVSEPERLTIYITENF